MNFRPFTTMVCPALLPPWNRTTQVDLLGEQIDDFPLPSSPHWAPIMITLVMDQAFLMDDSLERIHAPLPKNDPLGSEQKALAATVKLLT